MQDWVMEILRCPVTHSTLAAASSELLGRVNEQIAAGSVKTYGGQAVNDAVSGGLVNESESLLFVIVDDIPNLIPDDALVIGDIPSSPNASS